MMKLINSQHIGEVGVLTAVLLKVQVFWNAKLCRWGVVPGVSKGCGAFETSGTASPTRRRYSPGAVFLMTCCGYERISAVLDCAAQPMFNFHLF